ncbi:transcriptional regulator PpsR [Jannaschia sp. LMIT008]|uniref:transcriptional regulator PpsR n=1 Tax=Jannaschia maritima TaxID=3032585 RepID=UPI00281126C3|nr:transcriptional regulator PpsR [Jannaschia sp. LMIT008]
MATREIDFWNERAGPRIAPEYLGDILSTAADLALIVGPTGLVHSTTTNPLNSAIGKIDHWVGRDIRDFLMPDSRVKVMRQIAAVAGGDATRRDTIEVNHHDGAAWDAPIRYTFHLTGREGRVLMLGRDLGPVAELQQRLIRAQMALERDHEHQRVYETRFRVLLDETAEGFVLLDVANGRILDANRRAGELLGHRPDALQGTSLAQELDGRRRGELIDALCAAGGRDRRDVVRVRATRSGADLRLRPRLFRGGGERVLLCRIEPADGVEAAPARTATDGRLRDLFDNAADAIVTLDADGMITDGNEALLSLLDVDAAADLHGRSMTDFLVRGLVDLRVLTGSDGVRLYATRVVSAFGTQVGVEVTPVPLSDGGHALLMREADRTLAMREAAPSAGVPGPTVDNARALVGTEPLRDIVASMTDVIEKECIEAAVELTSNNRVAAAEMLGLSRQSLYVKLRKYGLLRRDEG